MDPRTNRLSRQTRELTRPLGIVAMIGVAVVFVMAIVGPILWSESASTTNVDALLLPPSWDHPFGTDAGGRDVLARALVATRLSVTLALLAALIAAVAGTFIGVLPVILPKRGARFVVSVIGFAIAFPTLLLTIVVSLTLGVGAGTAVIAIGIAGVPYFGRLVYTLSSSVAGRDFVAAARVLGIHPLMILLRHIIPNITGQLLVNASIMAGSALVAFAGLSYLGLGVQAPEYDWGRLLNEGLGRIYVSPGVAIAPAVAIVFAGVTFTLVGETLARMFGVESTFGRLPKDRPTPQPSSANAAPLGARQDAVLSVRRLSVAVPGEGGWRYPVRNVSFDVERGEIVGIVGESGSGKSLTCLAAGALLSPPVEVVAERVDFDGVQVSIEGRIDGERLPSATAEKLGTSMAFVFQDPSSSLNPAMRVGRQVGEPAVLHQGIGGRRAMAKAVEQLRAVLIPDPQRRAHQYPHEFSGGMRQRAMIAMGMIESPALIIADEPTTALDVTVQREVLRLLKEINDSKGTSILLVSHDIAVVAGMCRRVLVMYRGEIVEDISTADLVAGRAAHPYTRALLSVVPDESVAQGARFDTIVEGADFSVSGAGR